MSATLVLHVSAPYSRTATTLVLKMRSLVLKLYFDDFHRGCRVEKAFLARASLRLMSVAVPPCLSSIAPRYGNVSTSSSSLPSTIIESLFLQFRRMVLVLLGLMLSPTISAVSCRRDVFSCKSLKKVVHTSKYGDVREKFHCLENIRFKTLEHLLKTF